MRTGTQKEPLHTPGLMASTVNDRMAKILEEVTEEELIAYLHFRKSPPRYSPIDEVLSSILTVQNWPSLSTTVLKAPSYPEECMHKRKSSAQSMVVSPLQPSQPNFLLYKLGHPNFINGNALVDFPAVNDPTKCAVLLAPSGAGKTRKLFELLFVQFGFFIVFKRPNDKNDGSLALSSVVDLITQDSVSNWEIDNPNMEEFFRRRKRAEFAFQCVLIAFASVYSHWNQFLRRTLKPRAWLFAQLFPVHFFGSDLFETLAVELFKKCDPEMMASFKMVPEGFYIALDEAQILGSRLKGKFLSSHADVDARSDRRPLLSAVLSGCKSLANRFPILAGTGLSLLSEWTSVTSAMATEADFIFTSFPLLTQTNVAELLKAFLIIKEQDVERAAEWLAGRPRFTTNFISQAITRNRSINELLPDYVFQMTTKTVDDIERTIAGAFMRLKQERVEMSLQNELCPNPYYTALIDAFLLSLRRQVKARKSPALLEWGLGFSDGTFGGTQVCLEALVLETARVEIEKNFDAFEEEFLRAVSDSSAHLGTRFEPLVGIHLVDYFTDQTGGNKLLQGFHGPWSRVAEPSDLCGMSARYFESASDFFKFCEVCDKEHPKHESIFLFGNQAGPDVVLKLKSNKNELWVFVQVKVVKELSPDDVREALLTVDPALLWHKRRNSDTPVMYQDAKNGLPNFLEKLTNHTVIRVLVSAKCKVNFPHWELVDNQRGSQDLQLIFDPRNLDQVFGPKFGGFLQGL